MTAIVEFDPIGAETIHAALGPDSALLPGLDALGIRPAALADSAPGYLARR